jgi:hypothetical protein
LLAHPVGVSVLTLGASRGATIWILEASAGSPGLTSCVPFAAVVLLVALGSDYNVFLAARVWQKARRRPLRKAVETGPRWSLLAVWLNGAGDPVRSVTMCTRSCVLSVSPGTPNRNHGRADDSRESSNF